MTTMSFAMFASALTAIGYTLTEIAHVWAVAPVRARMIRTIRNARTVR